MRVLARAYGDRPLDRTATGSNERVIYLVNSAVRPTPAEEGDGVGFPPGFVFQFDDALFCALRDAWESGDMSELAKLWSQAKPLEEHS